MTNVLPFTPQPEEILRLRLPEALKVVHDPLKNFRVGVDPRYVFDFENGLRLIVSVDLLFPPSPPSVHFSASVETDTELFKQARDVVNGTNRSAAMRMLRDVAETRFCSMTGYVGRLFFIGFTPDGLVPHWHIPMPDWKSSGVEAVTPCPSPS